jgi:hypothetical protein
MRRVCAKESLNRPKSLLFLTKHVLFRSRKGMRWDENLKETSEIEKICFEAKVYRDGKELSVSNELRKRLYRVIAFLPIRKILDKGYTPEDRKKLGAREAAAVSMLDESVLTDSKFQKEVRDYLLKTSQIQENFPLDELEKDENVFYALLYLAHECVKSYKPKKEKESLLERVDEGKADLLEQLYGKKARKH